MFLCFCPKFRDVPEHALVAFLPDREQRVQSLPAMAETAVEVAAADGDKPTGGRKTSIIAPAGTGHRRWSSTDPKMAAGGRSRRSPSISGATNEEFKTSYDDLFQAAPGGRALRQDPMKEVQLSQVRNKALAKLGLGLEQESPIAKPWQSVFKPWFASPETEHDYREAAYALHRRFLVRLLVHGGIMYAFVALLWALFVSLGLAWSVGQNGSCGAICGPRGATVIMRFLGAAGQFAVALLVVCSSLGPRAIGITVMSLVYLLAAVPLADLARGGTQDEPAELMLVYLIVYRLLVPIFQIRHGDLLRPFVQAQKHLEPGAPDLHP